MNTYTSLMRSGITSLFAAVLFAAFNSPLHAQGFPTINCDAPGASLQKKIDSGGDGDRLFVTGVCDDGPYFIFGKEIELLGFTLKSTGATLSSSGSGDVLIVRGATVVLRNLTIDADGSGSGISTEGSSIDVEGVIVQNATAGIRLDGSSFAIVLDSEFNNNDLGIVILGSSNAFIHESTIQGSSSTGVTVVNSSNATVSNNTIINNQEGILVTKMSSLFIGGNLIENNVSRGVVIADQYGFLEAAVNTIQGNGIDVDCQARGIFESPVAQISNTKTTALGGCTVFGTIF